ncbi:MFS transporter [Thalassospiraceae bacterium LMO-JJ14]|nr:MFS transporter [Thalassospiraceae bacterium LMO-JJ14]
MAVSGNERSGKGKALILLALAEVLALSLWFSASAVVPALKLEAGISDTQASLYTSAVSIGFVGGTLLSAVLVLADRVPPIRLFALSALAAAVFNAGILFLDPSSFSVIVLRFLTGVCMAGVYPVGMKLASSWARRDHRNDTGFLVGLLVGALTLGSALPYLFNVAGGVDWHFTIAAASMAAVLAALLILQSTPGPGLAPAAPFNPAAMLDAWRNRPLRLANLGYFGHMWELYAMWGWIGFYLSASFTESGLPEPVFWAGAATFLVIAAGGGGSMVGGLFADRMGRTTLTIGAMTISGLCAASAGFLFGGIPLAMVALCLVWGATVVADSAQFSSCVIELADPRYVGTMLTVQTCIGFSLTLLTIHALPVFAGHFGWQWAMAPLAIGPALGVVAMALLRADPASSKLAGGRR